ncbi:prephenate dehydrogenase [Kitasatospora sp. NPDC058046]|uniref:prephenate dehydrogenase n=1 Tax=Kitasatospora sp. NPDC058046 TaxID=3346312 RepID=UPI0036DD6A7D
MATSVETNSGVATAITLVEVQLAELEKQKAALEGELERVTGYVTSLSVALDGLRAVDAALQPVVVATVGPSAPVLMPAEEAQAAEEPEPVEAAAGPLPAADKPAQKKATRRRVSAPAAATTETAPAKQAARKPRTTTAATEAAAPAKSKPKARTGKKTAAKKSASAAPTTAKRARGIADDVLSTLAAAGRPLRASEVSAALGADNTDDNVRTTLERLVKAGRAQRAGRGLFEALPNS